MPHLQPWPPQGPACPARLPSWLPASPCLLPGHPFWAPPGLPLLAGSRAQLKTCPDLLSRHGFVQNNPELLLQEPFPWDLPGDGDTVSQPGRPRHPAGREAGGPELGPRAMGRCEHLRGSVQAENRQIWAAGTLGCAEAELVSLGSPRGLAAAQWGSGRALKTEEGGSRGQPRKRRPKAQMNRAASEQPRGDSTRTANPAGDRGRLVSDSS